VDRIVSQNVQIRPAVTPTEIEILDQLLWEVLWQPLDLPRDTRASFKLEGESIELIAVNNARLVGGLVANWLSSTEVELRHIAVQPDYHGQGVGRRLVGTLVERVKQTGGGSVQTYARNTSEGFFARLDFIPVSEILRHPDFAQHGITFRRMRYVWT
jgi:N-acetylglutamate synthase-like GNAT family acetyltransferase